MDRPACGEKSVLIVIHPLTTSGHTEMANAKKHLVTSPRGLSERQAAALWGVSAGTHRKMVRLGIAPPPMDLPGIDRRLYDRLAQERAIDARSGVNLSTAPEGRPVDAGVKVVL
jgi:hypothetical protein